MKSTLTIFTLSLASMSYAQNVPIDFETGGNGATWTWTTFENDDNPALEVVDNPSKMGINTSNKVAKFIARKDGQPYAGCESMRGADIGDYQITASNSSITIMVYKSVISDVGIKLVTSTGWSKGELKVANTKVNEWEKLTFDFSTIDHESMTYNQIVIFPDFRDRSQDDTSYFDNLTIGGNTTSLTNVNVQPAVIYPNPAVNELHILSSVPLINEITLINKLGQKVMSEKLEVSSTNHTLDMTELQAGIYFLQYETSEGKNSEIVVVE